MKKFTKISVFMILMVILGSQINELQAPRGGFHGGGYGGRAGYRHGGYGGYGYGRRGYGYGPGLGVGIGFGIGSSYGDDYDDYDGELID